MGTVKFIAAFRLGTQPLSQSADNRNLMLKFHDKRDRDDVLLSCKRCKPTDLYVNEDLTPRKSNILFALRRVRRKSNGRISECGSLNGRIYAYIRPPNQSERHQRVFIDSMERLDSICQREFGIALSEIDMTRGD